MSRARFTVRGLMIAVATAGLLLFGVNMARRRSDYLARAESHRQAAFMASADAQSATHSATYNEKRAKASEARGDPDAPEWRIEERYERSSARKYLREAVRHQRLREKFERAARSPWLAVEPEPPESE